MQVVLTCSLIVPEGFVDEHVSPTIAFGVSETDSNAPIWITVRAFLGDAWDPDFLNVPAYPMTFLRLERWTGRRMKRVRIGTSEKPTGSSVFRVGHRRILTVSRDSAETTSRIRLVLPALLRYDPDQSPVECVATVDGDDFRDMLEFLNRKYDRLFEGD